jgi:hypothetical protein
MKLNDGYIVFPDGSQYPVTNVEINSATHALDAAAYSMRQAASAAAGFSVQLQLPVEPNALRALWRLDPAFIRWERLRFQMHRKGRPGWKAIR